VISPWTIVGVLVAWGASLGGASWFFYGAGQAAELAAQKREDDAAAKTRAVASEAAASAIAAIKVTHRTVQQEIQRELVERPVFRDCRSGPDSVRLFNGAIPGAGAVGGAAPGSVPASDAAAR
jgi:hypothetical protein